MSTTTRTALRWPTVVFDLDGTLVDTVALIVASFQHAHSQVLGVELDEATARSWIGRTLIDLYRDFPDPEGLRQAYLDFNLAHLETLQTSVAGVPALLDELRVRGAVVAVATSKSRAAAERSLAAAGITDLAPLTTALHDTVRHKPDPAPIRHALAAVAHDGGPAVYVGDAVVDVLAARAAGIDQVAVTWGAGVAEQLVAAQPSGGVATTVDELSSLLLG